MAKKIEPHLKTIGSYLELNSNTSFEIPEYQRAYSWEIKQCEKLLQDLDNFIDSGGTDPYFFGTIIINCKDDNNEDVRLSLIDGQQRTTTFILLLRALLLRLNEAIEGSKGDPNSIKLTSTLSMKRNKVIKILYRATDDDIFDILHDFENAKITNFINNYSINERYQSDLDKILNSPTLEVAENLVHEHKYRKKDNRYTNYFRNFKFFYNELNRTPSRINTFAEYILDKSEIIEIRSWNIEQAITMFNSLNSDGMPLLDADIISAKLYSNSGVNKDDFNKNWKELKDIVNILEQEKVVDLDGILMQYMYIKRALDKEYISERGAVSVTTPGLRRYYTETNKILLDNPLFLTEQLLKIANIWVRIKNYSIVKLAFKFNDNIKLYLISYLYRFEIEEINKTIVSVFLQHLLKLFAVLEVVETAFSSSKFKMFLFGLNTKLVDKNIGIEIIEQELNEHIKTWTKEEIIEGILNYERNPLVSLYEYIISRENDRAFYLPTKHEVEHIMPRSGNNIISIRRDAGIEDQEEFERIVNKLGNKILLEENINRSIQNIWFRGKIENSINQKSGYKDSVFFETRKLVETYKDNSMPLWTVEDIENRTKEIAEKVAQFIFAEILLEHDKSEQMRYEYNEDYIYLYDEDVKIGEILFPIFKDDIRVINRTYIEPDYRLIGLASKLVLEAYHYFKENKVRVVATCPYVTKWFERNVDKQDVIVKEEQDELYEFCEIPL